jgi:hypothetical protein
MTYVCKIFELDLRGRLQMYADDAIIFYGATFFNQLQDDMQYDMDTILRYFFNNKLTVNSD